MERLVRVVVDGSRCEERERELKHSEHLLELDTTIKTVQTHIHTHTCVETLVSITDPQ